MYKDKDKQREANRQAQARFKAKGITEGITNQGITGKVLPNFNMGEPSTPSEPRDPIDRKDWPRGMVIPDDSQGEWDNVVVSSPKRGKDIKCFADLPPDVQRTIDRLSVVDGKIDQTVKANRTAIAIHYQHLFPDRYYPQGAVLCKADYNEVMDLAR